MKKIIAFLSVIMLLFSCQDTIEKPDNLIEEDVMVDIIYDLSLLEAANTSDNWLIRRRQDPEAFIYKKYNIDSLQFVKSSQYYASDMRNYQKMYVEVGKRIELKKAETDSLISKKKRKESLERKKDKKLERLE